jgi:Domain of unknown function (DUF4149)
VRGLVHTLLWLALIVWIGEIVFLSFVVAPTVFHLLPRATAGTVMSALFAPYYAIGAVAGTVGLAATLVLRRGAGNRTWWSLLAVMIAGMLVATLYAGVVLQPRAHALRLGLHGTPPRREFERLHRAAVLLNGGVLLVGLASVAIAAHASRPPID